MMGTGFDSTLPCCGSWVYLDDEKPLHGHHPRCPSRPKMIAEQRLKDLLVSEKPECFTTGGAHEEDPRLSMKITWAKVRVCLHCRVLYVANLDNRERLAAESTT